MSGFGGSHRGGGRGGGKDRPPDWDHDPYYAPFHPGMIDFKPPEPPSGSVQRKAAGGDREYKHDLLRVGPLNDSKNFSSALPSPASGFTSGKHDPFVLSDRQHLHRIGDANNPAGDWFTEHPTEPRASASIRRKANGEAGATPQQMSYTFAFPTGTKAYRGPGPDGAQVYVPKSWAIEGARLISRKPLVGGADGAAGSPKIPEGGGASLPSHVRQKMEPHLGADLSRVKIYTGAESARAATGFGARAFTVQQDVHFGVGEYAPGTKEGDRLLAHELAHTVQAQKSGVKRKAEEDHGAEHGHAVSQPGEPAEKEADAVGDHVAEKLHGEKHDGSHGDPAHAQPDKAQPHHEAPAIAAKLKPETVALKKDDPAKSGASGPARQGGQQQTAAPTKRPRVDAPVPGLFDSIHGAPSHGMVVGSLKFADQVTKRSPQHTEVYTEVSVVGGAKQAKGEVVRSLLLKTDGHREFHMDMAFLDQIPKEYSWVSDDGKPLVRGQGTPLQTYVTLRQMKILGINYGDLGKPDFTKVKLSTIVNRRTIWDLAEFAKKQPGLKDFERIKKCHSYLYAETVITQAGGRIVNAKLDGGATITAGQYADEKHMHDELKNRGLDRKDPLRKNFDIILEVAPFLPSTPIPATIADK